MQSLGRKSGAALAHNSDEGNGDGDDSSDVGVDSLYHDVAEEQPQRQIGDPGTIDAVAIAAATNDPDEAAAIGAIITAGILRNEPAAPPPAAPCPAAPVPSATTRHMYETRAANDRRQKEMRAFVDCGAAAALLKNK